jgi:hypothetical protein
MSKTAKEAIKRIKKMAEKAINGTLPKQDLNDTRVLADRVRALEALSF